jgi:hypothetical protein
MVSLLLFISLALPAVGIEPCVEYRIRTSDLGIDSPTALRRDHTYPAPECYITRDGQVVLLEVSALWLITPDSPPVRLATDPMFVSLSASPTGRLAAVGGTSLRRVRLVDQAGAKRDDEFLLDFSFSANQAMSLGDTLLVTSGSFFVTEGKRQRLFGMATYDLRTGSLLRRFFETSGEERTVMDRGHNSAGFAVAFDVTPDGHLLVSRTTDYRLHEYTLAGEPVGVLGAGPPPDYHVPLRSVAPLDLTAALYLDSLTGGPDKERMRKAGESWFKTWTASCFPLVFNRKYAIIQRGRVPPYHIEVFSLDDRQLLGVFRTDSRLLYAERDGPLIYLLDEASDSLLRIGGYRLSVGRPSSPARDGRSDTPAPADPGMSAIEQATARLLANDRRTLVLCATPFDCGFPEYYKACSSFVTRHGDWDLLVVMSYRNRDALAKYCGRLARELSVRVAADPAYTKALLDAGVVRATPAVLAFDRRGYLRAATDLTEQLPFDTFLLHADRHTGTARGRDAAGTVTADYFYIIGGPPCERVKHDLLRLSWQHAGLELRLNPICDPKNYMNLRELERKHAGGVSHPLPVLVVNDAVLSGDSILPQLRERLHMRAP